MANEAMILQYTLSDIEKMAAAIAVSKMFGVKTKEEAIALMLVAQAEGRHPVLAARDYHVIEGKPSLKADIMLSRHQLSGGTIKWLEISDAAVVAEFSSTMCPTPVVIRWDTERAKKAGLTGKSTWLKYPQQMLTARVISEGVRKTNPQVIAGFYTPEEVVDFEPEKQTKNSQPKDDTPAATKLKNLPDTKPIGIDTQVAAYAKEILTYYKETKQAHDQLEVLRKVSAALGIEPARTSWKEFTIDEAHHARDMILIPKDVPTATTPGKTRMASETQLQNMKSLVKIIDRQTEVSDTDVLGWVQRNWVRDETGLSSAVVLTSLKQIPEDVAGKTIKILVGIVNEMEGTNNPVEGVIEDAPPEITETEDF
jgi:hypothetical protein